MPSAVASRGGACEVHHDMRAGIAGADVVMMLRLQLERMTGALVPSTREYFRFFGLDREKLAHAKPGVKVMHPGPMNRGVEIDSDVADDLAFSLIQDQVEMGVGGSHGGAGGPGRAIGQRLMSDPAPLALRLLRLKPGA